MAAQSDAPTADEMSIERLMPVASIGGRYAGLLRVLYVPADRARVGDVAERGESTDREYAGHENLPSAYWTYASPYWFLWARKVAPAAWSASNAIGAPSAGERVDGKRAWSPPDAGAGFLTLHFIRPVEVCGLVIRMTRPDKLKAVRVWPMQGEARDLPLDLETAGKTNIVATRVVAVRTPLRLAKLRVWVPASAGGDPIAIDTIGVIDSLGRAHWPVRASDAPGSVAPDAEPAASAVAKGPVADNAKAILRGLDWLARHQSPDGGWSGAGFNEGCKDSICTGEGFKDAYDIGLTGLSLLAFLGAGHTMKAGPHRERVAAGIAYLRRRQDPEGCFGIRRGHFLYNHAIATLAVAEAYGMTGSASLRRSVEAAVAFLLKAQNEHPSGTGKFGWRYTVQPGDNDTSVSAWATLALKSARTGGVHVPDEAFQGAARWVAAMVDKRGSGRIGYIQPGVSPVRAPGRENKWPRAKSEATTAAGIMTLILSGAASDDPRVQQAGRLLRAKTPDLSNQGSIDHYYWYYGTLASFQIGGDTWREWHRALASAVLGTQVTRGCARGSWDPDGPWGEEGGRVYATALMTMCLEVSHRFRRARGK